MMASSSHQTKFPWKMLIMYFVINIPYQKKKRMINNAFRYLYAYYLMAFDCAWMTLLRIACCSCCFSGALSFDISSQVIITIHTFTNQPREIDRDRTKEEEEEEEKKKFVFCNSSELFILRLDAIILTENEKC